MNLIHSTWNGPSRPENTSGDADFGARTLNAMLRGEISAAESYNLAINNFEGQPIAGELRHIRDEHHAAVDLLRQEVLALGKEPADEAGPWGMLATIVTGSAIALGGKPLLSALRQGEKIGVASYQRAACGNAAGTPSRRFIVDTLLPMCERHVAELRNLQGSLN